MNVPLSPSKAITNSDGTPTDYFIRWIQENIPSINPPPQKNKRGKNV